MLFLTSELASMAEITFLSARDTIRALVPGRGIMGRDVGGTWLSSRLQNQSPSFLLFRLIFSFVQFFFCRYHSSSLVGSAVLISFL